MNYVELAEQIENGTIKTGDRLFITDFRHDDILNKPIRNIKPTEVELTNNENLPPRKTVYYADYHFRPLGKTGSPLSTVIAPYDNTGYRSYTGVSVNIFLTLQEAKDCFLQQCEAVKKQAEDAKEQSVQRFDSIIREMDDTIKNSK